MKRIRGYSLLELLIVFGVFIAIVAIAGPKITELNDSIKVITNKVGDLSLDKLPF